MVPPKKQLVRSRAPSSDATGTEGAFWAKRKTVYSCAWLETWRLHGLCTFMAHYPAQLHKVQLPSAGGGADQDEMA